MKISSFTCRSSTVIGWLILPLIKILDFFFSQFSNHGLFWFSVPLHPKQTTRGRVRVESIINPYILIPHTNSQFSDGTTHWIKHQTRVSRTAPYSLDCTGWIIHYAVCYYYRLGRRVTSCCTCRPTAHSSESSLETPHSPGQRLPNSFGRAPPNSPHRN